MSDGVSVGTLIKSRGGAGGLEVDLLAGAAGLDRQITSPYVQKTGLALAGFEEFLRPGCALVLGESEVQFLVQLGAAARIVSIGRVFATDLPCVMLTAAQDAPLELVAEADRSGVPLLWTSLETAVAIARLTTLLEDRLAPRETRHAVLLDILGLGVLLTGESGIGKSECALDLIARGHRLVADDTVEIRCRGGSILVGRCPELTRHHVEIRGLGVVNVTDLFGVSATRSSKRVELVVHLERWDPAREYERLGLDPQFLDILGVAVPVVTMPVTPARNMAMLVEVAATSCCDRAPARRGFWPRGSKADSASWPTVTPTMASRRICDGEGEAPQDGRGQLCRGDGPVGGRQVARHPRPRGSWLLLRRQSANSPARDVRRPLADRRRRRPTRRGRR
jgi:HPr kinase/phosphorylase